MILFLGILGSVSGCSLLEDSSETPINAVPPERRDMPGDFDPSVADAKFSPPKGLTDNRLFSESLSTEEARITRLETAVQRLRDDVDEVMPSIRQLVAIEDEIEDLVGQLKTLIEAPPSISSLEDTAPPANSADQNPSENEPLEEPSAPISLTQPPLPMGEAKPPPATPEVAAKPKASNFKPPMNIGDAVIRNLRVADHADKTRIVLDSVSKIDVQTDFDTGEKLVVINTDAPSVGFKPMAAAKGSKNVDDISVAEINGGHEIIISLKKGVSVSKVTHIAPNKNSSDHRAFFDVMF